MAKKKRVTASFPSIRFTLSTGMQNTILLLMLIIQGVGVCL